MSSKITTPKDGDGIVTVRRGQNFLELEFGSDGSSLFAESGTWKELCETHDAAWAIAEKDSILQAIAKYFHYRNYSYAEGQGCVSVLFEDKLP